MPALDKYMSLSPATARLAPLPFSTPRLADPITWKLDGLSPYTL